MIIKNSRYAIYRYQDEFQLLDKFHQLEPMAGLFHLQINQLFILYNKFWCIVRDIVLLNCFSIILKQKYIIKIANNVNFHHFDNFLYMVIKALTITLCMHVVSCQTIDLF